MLVAQLATIELPLSKALSPLPQLNLLRHFLCTCYSVNLSLQTCMCDLLCVVCLTQTYVSTCFTDSAGKSERQPVIVFNFGGSTSTIKLKQMKIVQTIGHL